MSPTRPFWPLVLASALVGAGALGAAWFAFAPASAPPRPTTLYYADAQGMFLVPAQATLDAPAAPEAWARMVFDRLRAPDAGQGVTPVPADAALVEAAWAPPRWTLGVKLAKPPGSTEERLLVGALVRTFTAAWPGAREVRLKLTDAQGRPLTSQHLDLSAPLTVADVANTLDAGPAGSGVKSTVWWPGKDGGALVPVQIALAGGTGIPPRDAFERLVAGPPPEATGFLAPVAPPGAAPRWDGLDGGVAQIALGGPLPAGEPGRRFVEAAVLTLTEFPDVTAVRFTVDGRPLAGTAGPFRLDAPVARPAGAVAPAGTRPAAP